MRASPGPPPRTPWPIVTHTVPESQRLVKVSGHPHPSFSSRAVIPAWLVPGFARATTAKHRQGSLNHTDAFPHDVGRATRPLLSHLGGTQLQGHVWPRDMGEVIPLGTQEELEARGDQPIPTMMCGLSSTPEPANHHLTDVQFLTRAIRPHSKHFPYCKVLLSLHSGVLS